MIGRTLGELRRVDRTDLLHVARTVLAAVAAWRLSVWLINGDQAFLAPWSAMLVVNATVYRTFAVGAQQVAASVLGVLIAYGVGSSLGVDVVSLALTLAVCLLLGLSRPLREQSLTAATTALIVLLTGQSRDEFALTERLGETGLGIAVGVAVTVLVWPPLKHRNATWRVEAIEDAIADLLGRMAEVLHDREPSEDELDAWLERTREIDVDVDAAWGVVRQAWESGRLNPRLSSVTSQHSCDDESDVLDRLEQAVAEQRSMIRTLATSSQSTRDWDASFRLPWLDLLTDTADSLHRADTAAAERVTAGVDRLAHDLSVEWLKDSQWPVYGALMLNLRNIAAAAADVGGLRQTVGPAPVARRDG